MKRILKKDLEKHVQRLRADIRDLVLRPDSTSATMIRAGVHLEADVSTAIMFGSAENIKNDNERFGGIYSALVQN